MNLRQFFIQNHWWGKLLGAFFGYLLAGPVGALFGLIIGNFFDRGIHEHFNRPFWDYYAEKRAEAQKIFFIATFAVMGYIAKADGQISEQEILIAESFMDEMNLNMEQRTAAKKYFNEGKTVSFNLNRILNELMQQCSANSALLKLFLDIQYRAVLSVNLDNQKLLALNMVFTALGFAPLQQQYRFYTDVGGRSYHQSNRQRGYDQSQQNNQYYNDPEQIHGLDLLAQAYTILEVNKNSSKQEVKHAYRVLMSQNHPDKLIAKGLPEAMIKMANDKTQKIRKAYEQICASRGW